MLFVCFLDTHSMHKLHTLLHKFYNNYNSDEFFKDGQQKKEKDVIEKQ